MGDTLMTSLSMENHHPSTILSMDSSASSSHDDLDLEMNRHQLILTGPPDINLPLSADTPLSWNPEHCDILDVGLSTQIYETESLLSIPKVGKKCSKRVDSIWGAWFFFSFYFKPVLNDKSKAKIIRDSNGVSGFEKSDLQLDTFLVQHDMENMYMWVFKGKPENALGKMQLRSYMNGHSRQGERLFPFSVDKGFVRSHRMQRKHYRGLSNPQCVHGIEVVPTPNLIGLDEDDRKRWAELTGRDLNFTIPTEASDYGSWRNLPNTEFELDKPPPTVKGSSNSHSKKLLNGSVLNLSTQLNNHSNGSVLNLSTQLNNHSNGSVLNLSTQLNNHSNGSVLNTSTQLNNHSNGDVLDLSPVGNKRKKEFCAQGSDDGCYLDAHPNGPHWLNEFNGVMRDIYGPVTGAKTIYEDEQGYLIVISLPFVDLQRVKVSWRNTLTHGIVKVSCVSTSRTPFIKRHGRTFKLTDPLSEHCPEGEFVREIPLSTRIPEDGNIEAYYDGSGSVLEILVPKLREGPEEHEVRVCLRAHNGGSNNSLMLT